MLNDDHEIFRKLKEALARGGKAVLATVIAAGGEEALGAKALWIADPGRFVATRNFPVEWYAWAEERCRQRLSGGRERDRGRFPRRVARWTHRFRALYPGAPPHHRRGRPYRGNPLTPSHPSWGLKSPSSTIARLSPIASVFQTQPE